MGLIPSRKPSEKRHSCTFLFATDNNPLNDDKYRETGRSNDEANDKDPSNSGKLLQMERYKQVQARKRNNGGSQNKSQKSMKI